MAKDIIQELWDRGREEQTMTSAQIQTLLEPQIRRNAFSLRIWIWFYLAVLVVTLTLNGINIFGYRANPIMLSVQVGVSLLSLGFLFYGIYLLGDLAKIDADESVLATLRRRLRFHRTKLEIWIWIVAFTAYLLQFAINTMIDNQAGEYRINQPGVFIGVSIGMVLFIYAVMKIAQYPLVRELKAIVSDLENQVTDGTDRMLVLKRTWRSWSVFLAVVLTLLLIWGLIRAIQ